MPNVIELEDQEQCSYCKEWYLKPVSYHHTTEECARLDAALKEDQKPCTVNPDGSVTW